MHLLTIFAWLAKVDVHGVHFMAALDQPAQHGRSI